MRLKESSKVKVLFNLCERQFEEGLYKNSIINGEKYDCQIASNASDFHSLECEILYKDYKKANPYSGN